MVFSSLTFLYVFLPLCILLYFICPNKTYRNVVLVIMSLLFYAWGEPVYVLLMIASSLVGYAGGICVDKLRGTSKCRAALAVSSVLILGVLGVFKYTDFFISNINVLFSTDIPLTNLPLPIGVSFFTFQILSYVIDVYRDDVQEQHSFLKFLMYVTLFPQLIAGPIVRYKDISQEVDSRKITPEGFSSGITRFVIGLGKKVIIANNCGQVVDSIFNSGVVANSVLGNWLGILLFTLQIYFDFSGYSDMAIGLGRMFGFTYKENFNYPYISKSGTEFWRRWHISLGSFFRDYLYIPLGGNRFHHVRNILIVWFLTGFWHGASWNFVLWGLYYGVILLFEKKVLGRVLNKLPALFSHLYLVFITLIGWTIFYFTDFKKLVRAIATMFGLTGAPLADTYAQFLLKDNLWLIALGILCSLPLVQPLKRLADKIEKRLPILPPLISAGWNAAILILCTTLLIGSSYNPFLYFRF